MNPTHRTRVAVLALLLLPAGVAAAEALSYHLHNRPNGAIVSSGDTRRYIVYVPDTYNAASPAPLVISMHGAGLWPGGQRDLSLWNNVADREGIIVVYPSGIDAGGPRIWHVDHSPGPARDVRFIADLIDTLSATYSIDRSRIYADGLSNGGGMAFALSCLLADRIAAVGLVASAQTLPWSWCTETRPVPMIAFHGTADVFTPYEGRKSFIAPMPFPSIPQWTANWAKRNGCGSARDSVVGPTVTRRTYLDCTNDAAVVLYTITHGGHTWPGGGPHPDWLLGATDRSINATEEIWSFFAARRLQRQHKDE